MEDLKKTCLYDKHVALGAKMSPFGGFIMPIEYDSIITETQCRTQHRRYVRRVAHGRNIRLRTGR